MKLKEHFSLEKLKARDEKRQKSGRFNRMGAYIIDHFIQVIAENIFILVVWLILLALGQVSSGGDINIAVLPKNLQVPTIGLLVLMAIAYQTIVPLYILDGQTWGKRLIGLKIVRTDGSKATPINYLLRTLGILIEGFPVFSFLGGVSYLFYYQLLGEVNANQIQTILMYIFGVSVVWALFQKDRRAFHDYLAGTKVILVKSHDLVDYSRPISKDIDLSNL